MKIVLINPSLTLEEIYGKFSDLASFQPPIGLCSLAAYLIKYGYDNVRILDANILKLSIKQVVQTLGDDSPDAVGIYCNTAGYYAVQSLSEAIKKTFPELKIILGGPHPSAMPEETLKEIPADYCIMGEGEETLLDLVQHLDDHSMDMSDIDGLARKSEDHEIIVNRPRKRIEDLDALPFPAVHLLPPLSLYKLYLLHYKKLPYMTVMTSRGCPYSCIFCETPFGKTARFNSPEYVVSYIDYLQEKFDVKELHFCDDTFSLNEKRVEEICELIGKKKMDISWYAATRANIKDSGLFKLMKDAGCWICAIGVESGDPEILRNIDKQVSLGDVQRTCAAVLRSGLILKTFFIIGSPGETVESIDRTIQFAKSIKAHFPVFSLMTPFPGTLLWEQAEQYGAFDRSNFQKLLISGSEPAFVPSGLTKDILIKKQKEAFFKTYMNPGMALRQIATIRTMDDAKKITKAVFTFLRLQN